MLPNAEKKNYKKPQIKNYNNTNVIERSDFCIINQPIIRSRNESINLSQIADDIIDSIHFNESQEEKEKDNNEDAKKVNEIKIEKKYSEDNEKEDIEEKIIQPKRRTLIVKSRRSQKRIERELFNEKEDDNINEVEKDNNISEKTVEIVKINNIIDKENSFQSNNVQKDELEKDNSNGKEKEMNIQQKIEYTFSQNNKMQTIQKNPNELKEEKKDNENSKEHIESINEDNSFNQEGYSNHHKNESQHSQDENHKALTTEEQDELILQEIIANTKRLEEEEKKKKEEESLILQSINSKKAQREIPFETNISTIKPAKEEQSIERKKKENR